MSWQTEERIAEESTTINKALLGMPGRVFDFVRKYGE